MVDYSLVPVDHQPDFSDVSLVPVDHDPFGADSGVQEAQAQPAQPQPESPPQQPAMGAVQLNAGGPSDRSKSALADGNSSHMSPGDIFPSADAAAVAALQNINPTSQRYGLEYAGRIYHRWLGLGDYSYTPPIEGNAYSSDPGNRVLLPLLHSLGVNAGTYHTHTAGNDPVLNENYSPKDKQDSDDEGAPYYLGAPSGIIYKYSPTPNQPAHGQISVLGNTKGSTDKSPAQP